MTICFVASECVPYAKTGGLADVAGALPRALAAEGHEVSVWLPLHRAVRPDHHGLVPVDAVREIPVLIGMTSIPFSLWTAPHGDEGARAYFIDAPTYFDRDGLYSADWDEDARYIYFQHAVLAAMQRLAIAPDILHCNDWQTGLLPAFVRGPYAWDRLFAATRTVMTIHNIGYQGRFAPESAVRAGLGAASMAPFSPFEFHGSFSMLKAGIVLADMVTTVSPTYAREIRTPEHGHGLEGVIAERGDHVAGILNGIDPAEWSPSRDTHIVASYDAATLARKQLNRASLLEQMGLPACEEPVVGIVSRFAEQKGFTLLMPVFEELMRTGVRMVVLGSGDAHIESFFTRAAHAWPDRVAVHAGFNNQLAHRITAGADIFLMPSLYEPCGLNQMYSLAYGTVPVVRRTGGLADTVRDIDEHADGTGFAFTDATPGALLAAVRRAVAAFADRDAWRAMQLRGMAEDFTWRHSARLYLDLYHRLVDTP
jgi:starch synthase